MSTDFWYYTLSAVPQTLATLIALAATFVVFKLNIVSHKIQESRKDLRRFMLLLTSYREGEIHEIEPLKDQEFLEWYQKGLANLKQEEEFLGFGENMYKKFALEMKRIIKEEWRSFYGAKRDRILCYLLMKEKVFGTLLAIRQRILVLLARSLVVVSSVITISLIVLPHYDYFSYLKVSMTVVAAVVIFAILSLTVTAVSVWEITRSGEE